MAERSASDAPARVRSYDKGRGLAEKGHRLIPGGCHTYAKGDDQYPLESPPFLVRGRGCHVWDADGNEFIEYAMGLRAVTLGHAYPAVVEAATRQMQLGANFNRPSPIEVECAERFLGIVAGQDMVKFTKDGSAAIDAGLKLARAHTGRDMVAICADHPFFSSSDWFIGSTGIPGGVPQWVRDHTVKFRYNDVGSVETLFQNYPDRIACVILEPAKTDEPRDDFLANLKACCHRHGALLLLDEMITGFRWHVRGAQHVYGVQPDLSCFGKALGNGFAISALAGRRDIMELGGLDTRRERVFLLSTTHGAETHALAAAIAVMNIYENEPVIETLYARGKQLREGIDRAIAESGVRSNFRLLGRPCCLMYSTLDEQGHPSQGFRTLFLQELLRRGILAPSLVVSYSHTEADIDNTVRAVGEALEVYARALNDGLEKHLIGPPVKPVYRRFV